MWKFLLSFFLLIFSYAYTDPLLEAKAGYFFFYKAPMKKVYDQGGLDVQISGTFPIWEQLHLYLSIEWLEKSGSSLGIHQKTSLWEVPLSFGLKPLFHIGNHTSYYFALGPRYVFARVHNHSSFVDHRMKANGWGGFANTGFLFKLYKQLTLDLFGEYSYAKLSFHSSIRNVEGQKAQMGGLVFGGGIGYAF